MMLLQFQSQIPVQVAYHQKPNPNFKFYLYWLLMAVPTKPKYWRAVQKLTQGALIGQQE